MQSHLSAPDDEATAFNARDMSGTRDLATEQQASTGTFECKSREVPTCGYGDREVDKTLVDVKYRNHWSQGRRVKDIAAR